MDKKGSVRDIILIAVVVFSMGLVAFILHFTANTAVTKMLDVPTINESESTRTALESFDEYVDRFDYIIFALFIGLTLALIVTGWVVGGHPIFMFLYFIVVTIGVVLSAMFANVWEQVSQASAFGTTVTSFPLLNHILNNFPIYIAVIGIVGLIVMFAKPFIAGNE